MSCVLRVGGKSLSIDDILSEKNMLAEAVWRKDEVRCVSNKPHKDSGANYLVSDADLDDFKLQVGDAIEFVRKNAESVRNLMAISEVEYGVLDFAVAFYQETFAVFCSFPTELIQLAAHAKVGLEISFYPCSDEKGEEKS